MLILDGKAVAKALKAELAEQIFEFTKKSGKAPGLAVILVGDDPASHVYVKNKENACAALGIRSARIQLPSTATQEEVLFEVQRLNELKEIDAFLVQLPLPSGLKTEVILDAIDPKKDADGLHPNNMGLLWANRMRVAPCTPWGVMRILKHYQIPLAGKTCVVVGRSQIVGRPMSHFLTQADGTVTVCHSRTPNLSEITRTADIIVVAAGKRAFLGKEDFKQGAVVIDVGIHGSGSGNGLCGDVRFEELEGWASAATPVPGGVGPMTIACLLENTLKLAKLSRATSK